MTEASSLLKDEKFYSKLDYYVNDINTRVVRLPKISKQQSVQTAMKVVGEILHALKADPVFKSFYNRITYVGSFYDRLRVHEATEFDLNIIFRIPCRYDLIQIENNNVHCGFVRLNVNGAVEEAKLTSDVAKVWQKWIDKNGYIRHDQVLRWWESIMSKVLLNEIILTIDGKACKVSRSKSGPANTLHIVVDQLTIDIDLVPAFEFPKTRVPPTPIRWIESMAEPWVVVPKPMDDNTFWRVSFPAQEKRLMHAQLSLKYINRLLKKFRDANNLNIPSYYIKTLFLWEAFEQGQRNNKNFWRKPISYLFPYMVVKLAQALETKTLKFFWHKKFNLFKAIKDTTLDNMAGMVKRKLKKLNELLEKNDDEQIKRYIYELFGISWSAPEKVSEENHCVIL